MNINKNIKKLNIFLNKIFFIIILIILQLLIIKIKVICQNNIKKNEDNQINTKNKEINFNTVYFWNSTLLKNEMHKYSLYDKFKKPLLSLILKIYACKN